MFVTMVNVLDRVILAMTADALLCYGSVPGKSVTSSID
jgi:hypothetical protein